MEIVGNLGKRVVEDLEIFVVFGEGEFFEAISEGEDGPSHLPDEYFVFSGEDFAFDIPHYGDSSGIDVFVGDGFPPGVFAVVADPGGSERQPVGGPADWAGVFVILLGLGVAGRVCGSFGFGWCGWRFWVGDLGFDGVYEGVADSGQLGDFPICLVFPIVVGEEDVDGESFVVLGKSHTVCIIGGAGEFESVGPLPVVDIAHDGSFSGTFSGEDSVCSVGAPEEFSVPEEVAGREGVGVGVFFPDYGVIRDCLFTWSESCFCVSV